MQKIPEQQRNSLTMGVMENNSQHKFYRKSLVIYELYYESCLQQGRLLYGPEVLCANYCCVILKRWMHPLQML